MEPKGHAGSLKKDLRTRGGCESHQIKNPSAPPELPKMQGGPEGEPKGNQREPKGAQGGPKGCPKRAKKAPRDDPDSVIMQAGAQFWKIGAVKTVLFVYFTDPST